MQDKIDNLPSDLRAALLAEIDSGETLRWCGRPCTRRVARMTLVPALCLGLFFGLLFGGMVLYLGYRTRAELLGLVPSSSEEQQTWVTVWVSLTLGWLIIAASLVVPVLLTWCEAGRARRTVYALTETRVFTLRTGRGGRARVQSVEPAHPLSLNRRDLDEGRGDIELQPAPTGSSRGPLMRLVGVAEARSVERLIRATFDPVGSEKTGG